MIFPRIEDLPSIRIEYQHPHLDIHETIVVSEPVPSKPTEAGKPLEELTMLALSTLSEWKVDFNNCLTL